MNLQNIGEVLTTFILFLPRLGGAILIFVIFWIAARVLRGAVTRYGKTRRLSQDLVNMMEQVTETMLLLFGGVTAIGTLGIDVGAMIAGLGLVGFALGFALKDIVSNFVAGFLILLYNPFVRGDDISVTGNDGRVVAINMRYTVLETGEGKRVLIPNSTLFANAVTVTRRVADRMPGSDSGPD